MLVNGTGYFLVMLALHIAHLSLTLVVRLTAALMPILAQCRTCRVIRIQMESTL
ncbi:hypothetical protein BD309DRAFT_959753, partial [Dichomitus squalens]